MVLFRPATLRAAARVARPARAFRAAEQPQTFRTTTRRNYASGADLKRTDIVTDSGVPHLKSVEVNTKKGEDMPWLIAGVVITVPATWYILSGDSEDEDAHATPGKGHGKGQHEEKMEGKDEKPEEEATPKEVENKPEPTPADDSKQGKGDTGQSEEELGYSAKKGEKAASKDENKSNRVQEKLEKGSEGATNEESDPAKRDVPDPHKEEAKSGDMSGKQEGFTNKETHHPYNFDDRQDKSRKGEGVAETTKLKGTVSVNRPTPENKDEQGKTEQDKSQ